MAPNKINESDIATMTPPEISAGLAAGLTQRQLKLEARFIGGTSKVIRPRYVLGRAGNPQPIGERYYLDHAQAIEAAAKQGLTALAWNWVASRLPRNATEHLVPVCPPPSKKNAKKRIYKNHNHYE